MHNIVEFFFSLRNILTERGETKSMLYNIVYPEFIFVTWDIDENNR